jgi:2-aminoethylphosphonate-pyruvate transaminase
MNMNEIPDNPYLLLTPGPLSTSKTVKASMLNDWCTWDDEYNIIVQEIRERLVLLATANAGEYTSVLMQGSGTFVVESVIGSVIPPDGKLLVLANGSYGNRIVQIAGYLKINCSVIRFGDLKPVDAHITQEALDSDPDITHVAMVHCETTTGMLNPVEEIGHLVKQAGKCFIVDAMSSFGGIPMDIANWHIDFIISSANKCIQGVPGFGFAVAKTSRMQLVKGLARSLSLDLYDQWETMEKQNGKWRFTSPTHVVRAFRQALDELEEEGGVAMRYRRYRENQQILVAGMKELGFRPLLDKLNQSPIITTFLSPASVDFEFREFYHRLKACGFVIYPGKVTEFDCFRIGNIGEVYPEDIIHLLTAVKDSMYWTKH